MDQTGPNTEFGGLNDGFSSASNHFAVSPFEGLKIEPPIAIAVTAPPKRAAAERTLVMLFRVMIAHLPVILSREDGEGSQTTQLEILRFAQDDEVILSEWSRTGDEFRALLPRQ